MSLGLLEPSSARSAHSGHTYVGSDGRRTARDFAECLRLIAEEWFPQARRIVLVEDNLNTHKMGSLYERYPARQAKALADWFEFHYTPKHGSSTPPPPA